MNFDPLSSPYHFTRVSPTNFSRRAPTPIRLAPRPGHLAQARESLATSSHLPCPPRALSPASALPWYRKVYGVASGRLRPEEAAHGFWAGVLPVHGPAAGLERHSPPGCGGPLPLAGAVGKRRASGPAGTWRGGDERCLPDGAAETGREAAWGGEGPAGAPVRQLFRPSPEPELGLPRAPLGPPLPARCGSSGPGLKLNTLGPKSSLCDPPRSPRTARFPAGHREEGLEVAGFLLRLAQTYRAVVQQESGDPGVDSSP